MLFDLSGKDELALADITDESASWGGRTLSRASLAGGAPRPLYEGVVSADFGSDDSLVLIRFQDARFFIEYPPGNVVLNSTHPVACARLSPDLKYIAFQVHPVRGDDRGTVQIIDRTGKPIATSTQAWALEGLAWAPSGKEVWFSAGYDDVSRQIHALSLAGQQRRVISALLQKLAPQRMFSVQFGIAAARAIFAYDWPLNVRELEKALETALVLSGSGVIELTHLPPELREPAAPRRSEEAVDETRKAELEALLRQHAGNVSAVARAMGKARMQIQRWMDRYALDPRTFRP